MKRLIAVLLLAASLLAGCGSGGSGGSGSGSGSGQPGAADGATGAAGTFGVNGANVQTVSEQSEASWIIEVDDTKKGTYTVQGSGKSFDIEAELCLVASKSGGDDICGDYKGSWLLTFKTDLAKLSDGDVQLAGNVMFDRLCPDLSFTMQPYDRQEYGRIRKTGLPDDIAVEPLVDMDGMASFISNFRTVKWEKWNATGKGKVYMDVDSNFLDNESIPVGINILAWQDEVTVDIPTYSSVWKLGSFSGTIKKYPAGKEPGDIFDSALSRAAEGKKNENKGFDTDSDGNVDTRYDYDGNMTSDSVAGSYTTDSEGHEGIDSDGDGKLDLWVDDEGRTHIDYNHDGVLEIIEGEYSDGAGE